MTIAWLERLSCYGLSKSIVVLLFLLSLLSIVMQMIGIGIFIPVFEYIFNGNEYFTNENSDKGFISYIVIFIQYLGLSPSIESLLLVAFLFYFSSQIFSFLIAYINIFFFGKMIRDMRNNFLVYYLNADSEYYDKVKISDVVNVTFSELVNAVGGVLAPIKLMVALVSAVGSIVVLFFISYELTLYSILFSIVALVYPAFLISRTTKVGRKNTKHNALLTSFLVDRLRSPRLVRLCGTAEAEIIEYKRITEKQRGLTLHIQLLKEKIGLVFEPTVIFTTLVMLYISVTYLDMDPASVFVFMIIMIRLVPIVRTFLNAKQLINRTVGPIEAIDSILDEMSKASLNNNECLPEDSIDNNFLDINKLQLVTVSYRYSAKEPFVLSDISLDLDQSTVNAVVGPSGGGKSTLIDIITGYRSPTTGKILLNGEEANDINNYKISNLLSYVPQDPQLFDGEVGEHIFYGNKTLTYDDMLKASELSGAHNFIKNLQNGYATVLNNNGSNFSGGQRFRIDFARALLSNAPLLVLDEPLSGLDYAGKNLFIKSINKIKKETSKIIIIITHDLSFYELFDKIIVIENGVIDTHTTHKELIESNKWYRNGFNNDL